jgi:hypothetical protein
MYIKAHSIWQIHTSATYASTQLFLIRIQLSYAKRRIKARKLPPVYRHASGYLPPRNQVERHPLTPVKSLFTNIYAIKHHQYLSRLQHALHPTAKQRVLCQLL